jgi:Protein of unknown function (DUF1761)
MTDFISLMFVPFSHWEILMGGTLIFFVLGWTWYNPITPIGRAWMRLNGFKTPKPEDMPKGKEMAVMLIFQLFMGFVVTHTVMTGWILAYKSLIAPDEGFRHMFTFEEVYNAKIFATLFIIKMYMGFVFIKDLGHWYFEKKPFGLILIGVGYYLVGILGVCGLLSYFL